MTTTLAVFGIAALIVLYFTYSRSAYIGAALTIFGIGWLSIKSSRAKRWLLLVAAAVCVLGGGTALLLRHNARFEDTFFHTSQLSRSPQSSNQNRTSALQSGVHDVLHEPFGRGPGTAGPASVHNNHPARISENYYLQIGQETGWLGLGLFIVINILVAKELWQRRGERDCLALALFASLIGLTFVNLLSHAWADDTLAYLWWGLAGIALAPIMQTKAERIYGKTKKSKAKLPAQVHPAR
jgi:O-antigen ligase